MNQPDESEFFNNPEQPQELLQAQNEQLMQAVQTLQQQVGQNPLAEAEAIKAQTSLVTAQTKQETEVAKMALEQEKFRVETIQNQQQFSASIDQKMAELVAKLELEYTKIEAENNIDIPGKGMEANFIFDPATGKISGANNQSTN
jgi:multidrug efflux pump subunit AcrA (membrane-fusion protein)